jgi:hypothetical protein
LEPSVSNVALVVIRMRRRLGLGGGRDAC